MHRGYASPAHNRRAAAAPSWCPTIEHGPDERLYPANEIALIVEALAAGGIAPADALRNVGVPPDVLHSVRTRVSVNQVLQCCRNAVRLSADPFFAYHLGLRAHVATYGMYGFGILSSTSFREAFHFAIQYHALLTPIVPTGFREDAQHGIWSFQPIAHPAVDAPLYKFLVEFSFGVAVAIHRDIMGPHFVPEELRVVYQPSQDPRAYRDVFGCPFLFGQAANELLFDAKWLNTAPSYGDRLAHATVVSVCDQFLQELQQQTGTAGQVRRLVSANLARPGSLHSVARHLKMSPRTLRRKLHEEKTSLRKIVDEVRTYAALKHLRETTLTVEQVADRLGFSDEANFRRAFRRWTKGAPRDFRGARQ